MFMLDSDTLAMLIVFGSISVPISIGALGTMLRERRQDLMQREQMRNEHRLEELRIKTEMENRILGPSPTVTENLTAEVQALREELRQVKEELGRTRSTGTDYVR